MGGRFSIKKRSPNKAEKIDTEQDFGGCFKDAGSKATMNTTQIPVLSLSFPPGNSRYPPVTAHLTAIKPTITAGFLFWEQGDGAAPLQSVATFSPSWPVCAKMALVF